MTPQQRKEETIAYINKVVDIFKNDWEKYKDILEVIEDYQARRINLAGVVARLNQLFKGHKDLIYGFNVFLPARYKIKMSWTDEIAEAAKLLNKLKTRFQVDDRVCKLFVGMLRTRNTKVVQEIATLLQDHRDLLDEFTQYINETSGTICTQFTSVQNTLLDGAGSSGLAITTEQQMHVDKPAPTKMSIQVTGDGHDKAKVTALSMDNDKNSRIFLKRNICKYACNDELSSQAMEGLQIINGLKPRIICNSSKVAYVLNTEDILIRTRSGRRILHQNDSGQEQAKSSCICSSRIKRFRKMFSIM